MKRLKVTEIFLSLQGETNTVGLPTIFIRLTGCPLRCQYCDTEYAFSGGQWHSLADILRQVAEYSVRYVTVTGGEPLAQKSCVDLLKALCDQSYEVSLETSGAIDVSKVDTRVVKVIDIKTPGSGEMHRNLLNNMKFLNSSDQLKFVICDYKDYEWAKHMLITHRLLEKAEVLFSASAEQLTASELADWIIKDRLEVRFQLQLHKILWGNEPGR